MREYIKDLVSVITPIYNSEKFLSKMLYSIYQQTYEKIEIILVDDCSTDNSVALIEEEMKTHTNIILYKQEKNMGAGYARNKALEIAKGQYVAFLDSDDMWYPNKIEDQIKLLKSKQASFAYAAIEMIDEDDKIVKTKRKIKETCSYNYLLHNTIIATSSVVIDRTKLGDFRMPLRRGGQDYATWLKLLRNGNVALGINETLVKYRLSNNSLSSNKFKSIKQVYQIQVQDEKINPLIVFFNTLCFCFNAFKKYFLK